MRTSKRRALLALIAALVLCSCGLDGGSRGTGITSTAQGNVASVQMSTRVGPQLRDFSLLPGEANAASPVEGITVTVEEVGAQTTTDAAGLFSLHGNFEGHLTLLFTRLEDAIRARTAINIPAGGTLTLNDVRIDTARGTATTDSEDVDFIGQITEIDCASQTLILVASRHAPSDTDTYTLRLDTSSLRDPQGNQLSCAELRNGQLAHVHGTVNADGSFGHAQVVVE